MRLLICWGMGVCGLALMLAVPADAQLVRSGAGATAADIQDIVNLFRDDLGALNPNLPGSFGSGRREINWDGVPDAFSSPNAFPGDFFNGDTPGRARGVVFSTPGSGFEVSARLDNPTDTPINFGNIDPSYESLFAAFSPQRLFTAIDSTITDVAFFIPGTNVPAVTRGFGSVFSDVDLPDSTSISYFDVDDNLLGTFFAPQVSGDQTFSFLGVSFASPIVSRVRIVSGNTALGPGVLETNGTDLVVMDDFLYGEPVPEPASLVLLVLGGLILAARSVRSASRKTTDRSRS